MKFQNLKFNNTPIFVYGDLMLDVYQYGEVNRISPEAPVPVFKEIKVEYRLGGACNVASNIKTLSGNPILFGLTGFDESSKILENIIIKNEINFEIVKSNLFNTIVKKRIISSNQQLLRIDSEKKIETKDAEKIIAIAKKKINESKIVVISDYNKGATFKLSKLIRYLKKLNKTVIIDPKHHEISKYAGVDYITPNIKELMVYIGGFNDDSELENKVYSLMINNDIKNILLTRSEEGLSHFSIKNNKIKHVRSSVEKVEVFDVSGAGDSVVAILSLMLNSNISIEKNLNLINKVGAKSVSKFGTYSVKYEDLTNE